MEELPVAGREIPLEADVFLARGEGLRRRVGQARDPPGHQGDRAANRCRRREDPRLEQRAVTLASGGLGGQQEHAEDQDADEEQPAPARASRRDLERRSAHET